jgi:predicted NBD/HSP70 family sugar kinase
VKAPGLIAVVVAAAHGIVAGVVRPDGEILSIAEATSDNGQASANRVLTIVDGVLASAGAGPEDLDLAVLGLPGPSGNVADHSSGHLRRFRHFGNEAAMAVLSQHLGCPAVSENDANLGALGEATDGAGSGLHTVLYTALTHGTGSGLIIGGRIHRGRSGLAGEVGHLHTRDDGPLCECGARGCFWQTVSIPSLLAELAEAHGRAFTVQEISAAAAGGELDITRALSGFGHALGRRLADAVVFIDPDAIVVDSVLGAAADVIADGVREAVNRFAPPAMASETLIVPGTLGAGAYLKGAVALVRQENLNRIPV